MSISSIRPFIGMAAIVIVLLGAVALPIFGHPPVTPALGFWRHGRRVDRSASVTCITSITMCISM